MGKVISFPLLIILISIYLITNELKIASCSDSHVNFIFKLFIISFAYLPL